MASPAAAKKCPRLFHCCPSDPPDQPEIRLVNQRRRLQRLTRRLVRQFRGRQLAQLVVHQRQQLLGRRRIAGFDLAQDFRDVAHNLVAEQLCDGLYNIYSGTDRVLAATDH